MTRLFVKAITEIELVDRLIDRREFSQALDRLRDLLAEGEVRSDEGLCAQIQFHCARCFFQSGNYDLAKKTLGEAERLAAAGNDHSIYAGIRQLQGMINHLTGNLDTAVEDYLDAHAFWKRSKSLDKLFGCFANIGMVHFQRGDLLAARLATTKALDLAQSHNSRKEQFLAKRNLARIMLFAGQFSEVEDLIREQLLTRELNDQSRNYALQIRAMRLVALLKHDLAKAELARLVVRFRSANIARDVAVCLEYLGLNEYFAGNYAKAKEYYQQVLDMPEPTASAVAQTKRMLTDVYIAEGNWPLAKQTAAEAETAITKINERIELGALWRAHGQIAAQENDAVLMSINNHNYAQAA